MRHGSHVGEEKRDEPQERILPARSRLAGLSKTSALRAALPSSVSAEPALRSYGPVVDYNELGPPDNELIRNFANTGEPIGERILVHRKVQDDNGRPVPNTRLSAG